MIENKTNNGCFTIDELLSFTSIKTLDKDAMDLITKVNSHIFKCKECRDQLRAIQSLELAFDGLHAARSAEAETTLDKEHPDF